MLTSPDVVWTFFLVTCVTCDLCLVFTLKVDLTRDMVRTLVGAVDSDEASPLVPFIKSFSYMALCRRHGG